MLFAQARLFPSQFREDSAEPSIPVQEFSLIAYPLAQSFCKTPFQTRIWTQIRESSARQLGRHYGLFSCLVHWTTDMGFVVWFIKYSQKPSSCVSD